MAEKVGKEEEEDNRSGSNNNNKNIDFTQEPDFNSSFFFEELEKELLSHGLDEVELYVGNRALIVLGDFFYDEYTARDYERGLVIKGRSELLGKAITFSRNTINHLLTTTCEISGLGKFRLTSSITWEGKAEPKEIENILSEKRVKPYSFSFLDMKLCRLLKSRKTWKYMIAEVERTMDETDVLVG